LKFLENENVSILIGWIQNKINKLWSQIFYKNIGMKTSKCLKIKMCEGKDEGEMLNKLWNEGLKHTTRRKVMLGTNLNKLPNKN
jgi:hypothetical protein